MLTDPGGSQKCWSASLPTATNGGGFPRMFDECSTALGFSQDDAVRVSSNATVSRNRNERVNTGTLVDGCGLSINCSVQLLTATNMGGLLRMFDENSIECLMTRSHFGMLQRRSIK